MVEVLETLGIPLFLLGTVVLGYSFALRGMSRVGAVIAGTALLTFIPVVANA